MELLRDGPTDAGATIILAHGAGAGMDSVAMSVYAKGLSDRGFAVVRFNFPYMAKSRSDGKRRAPDPPPVLLASWREAIAAVAAERVVIGGKSMGGRIASMVADNVGVNGLVCLGYPFHPPGRPRQLRVAHLEDLETPALIVQGSRDAFGTPEQVAGYPLSPRIQVVWIDDGDHSFKPLKRSGRTYEQNVDEALDAVADFVRGLPI